MDLEVLIKRLHGQVQEINLLSATTSFPPTLVLTSAGSLHSSSRPLTIPTPNAIVRRSRSAPLSGPVESSGLRRLLRLAPEPPPDARARLLTLGVGEGASVGGAMLLWRKIWRSAVRVWRGAQKEVRSGGRADHRSRDVCVVQWSGGKSAWSYVKLPPRNLEAKFDEVKSRGILSVQRCNKSTFNMVRQDTAVQC